jgi:proline iminopeptidase
VPSARERYLAFRAAQGRPPRLERHTVRVRGLDLAVWTTPADGAPPDAVPLCCVNGGLLFDHKVLWPTLAPLAAGRRLVFYDQRGRGASAAPPGARAARIEHDAGDLAALRAAVAPILGRDPRRRGTCSATRGAAASACWPRRRTRRACAGSSSSTR